MRSAAIRINKARFEAFSDGVFAIAITLLVLGFQVPKLASPSGAGMAASLIGLWPQYLVYVASFITVGIMWFNHYALFHHVRYVTYAALVANLTLLLLVAFLPFPTQLLGQYGLLAPSVFLYCVVMFAIALAYGALYYVVKLAPGERGSVGDYLRTRSLWNTLGPIVYALAMLLAQRWPLWSMILVSLMAIFYASPGAVAAALAASSAGAPPENAAE